MSFPSGASAPRRRPRRRHAPYFIEQMHNWISQNDVGYHVYFEYDAPTGTTAS
jgi:hypothetical protein